VSSRDGDTDEPPLPPDDGFIENLNALSRDLDDIEDVAASALAGESIDHSVSRRIANTPSGLTYAELTTFHRQRRETEGWGKPELADILDPAALQQLEEWRGSRRFSWDRSDLLVVGFAGLLGALGNLYANRVDTALLSGLSVLKTTDQLRRWEKETARLPIDYTGVGFGGPAHRVRSAGHDIGRFLSALDQIRTGTFEGTWWLDGQRMVAEVTTTRSGLPFARVPERRLALVLLLKHWAADFVTPMSLPLPGWTLLAQMPDPDLRKFALDAYAGTNSGEGLNLRSGIVTPSLGMLATEILISTCHHLAAFRATGSARLPTAVSAKQQEMLLAAHAAAGAISLSKAAAVAVTGEAAVAVRHLNVPVLLRIGMLALKVRSDAAARAQAGAPSWEQLLSDEASTWTLPEAAIIADLLT